MEEAVDFRELNELNLSEIHCEGQGEDEGGMREQGFDGGIREDREDREEREEGNGRYLESLAALAVVGMSAIMKMRE